MTVYKIPTGYFTKDFRTMPKDSVWKKPGDFCLNGDHLSRFFPVGM
jgi:hypothetical protein